MDQSLLLALPDDALLAVLAFLPPRQLFDCRVLCRRLRDLCLHADLWRRVRLSSRDSTLRAALRLAPCLREVNLYYTGETDPEPEVTACVVARLKLFVSNLSVARASAAVLKQSRLGGVKELVLAFDPISTRAIKWNIHLLAVAISSVNHLHSLQICNYSREPLLASLNDLAGISSLKKLSYTTLSQDTYLDGSFTEGVCRHPRRCTPGLDAYSRVVTKSATEPAHLVLRKSLKG
ncbi:uncharacterized protein LOC117639923 [Thrips palmi]|uniref:Uncharacterized protein LOC117639923 n=1 Tax=Thrips palmi TaxID=161013 RepID=A0A6P8XXT2_THRPL|nr:uncharacterized protein LOC117639923 [Thrips palmi]XP_034231884.1 uncharacterized protein LOC117639923 [Thrips palmi]XP_034231885.1 uncharacterized protein LOC117639923 [Thrips palmi]XP_034231886.1 uncharacterized protein LOC117639923 [Thrips palmi]XP_034231887.1 uncharacterized protein LOC117639923 [Thrips palmi]XP_034231888.1 uncharacterized protein LOC117639923 [Thrips palmi]